MTVKLCRLVYVLGYLICLSKHMGKHLIKIARAGFSEAKAEGSKTSGARKQQVT